MKHLNVSLSVHSAVNFWEALNYETPHHFTGFRYLLAVSAAVTVTTALIMAYTSNKHGKRPKVSKFHVACLIINPLFIYLAGTIMSNNEQALEYHSTGDFQMAMKIYRNNLNLLQRIHGDDPHQDVITIHSNIGNN